MERGRDVRFYFGRATAYSRWVLINCTPLQEPSGSVWSNYKGVYLLVWLSTCGHRCIFVPANVVPYKPVSAEV